MCGAPPTRDMATQFAHLVANRHPSTTNRKQRQEGLPTRSALVEAAPFSGNTLELLAYQRLFLEQKAAKEEEQRRKRRVIGIGDHPFQIRRPDLALAEWCKQANLTAKDFAQDDRKIAFRNKRRLRGKYRSAPPSASESEME